MSTKEENSLAVDAHHQISICCETLCDKSIVKQYITSLEERIKLLEEQLYDRPKRSDSQ